MENKWDGAIRILMLEDNPDDVELIARTLKKSDINYTMRVIDTEEQLKSQNFDDYDIVLCDYKLANFDGLRSIIYIREYSDIPIISVSGSISEELSLDLLIAGSNDFVKKSFLKRLPIVITRELNAHRLKRAQDESREKFSESQQMFDSLFNGLDIPLFIKDKNCRYRRINMSFCKLYERGEAEIIGKTDEEINWPYLNEQSSKDDLHILTSGVSTRYDFNYITDDGKKIWLEVTKNPILIGGKTGGIIGFAKDVTRRKDAVAIMERSQHILHQAEELTESGSFQYDAELDLVVCSKNLVKMLGLHSNQISLSRLLRLVKPEDRELFHAGINESIEKKKEYRMQHRYYLCKERQGHFEILFRPDYKDETGNIFYGIILDTTQESKESISRIEYQEDAQSEIARELHDNLGQKLSATSMFLGQAEACDHCGPVIAKSSALLNEGIEDLSKMLGNISVKHITDISLTYALEKLTSYVPESMNLEFECNIDESKISKFVKTQIYRVVQETLNNAAKYSRAKNLKIILNQDGSILSMVVEDDGDGFEMENKELGNGLMNITYRVKRSNGLINIDSKLGAGTKVQVRMPVN